VPLREHLDRVRLLHEEDLANGYGSVFLPGALDGKYLAAAREWRWQYVFPARDLSRDPRSGEVRRHHLESTRMYSGKEVPDCLRRSIGEPKAKGCGARQSAPGRWVSSSHVGQNGTLTRLDVLCRFVDNP
jgi:hypothetical protein